MNRREDKEEPGFPEDARRPGTALSSEEERALLADLRSRDPGAYERLIRLYGGRMLAVARRILANEEDARDSVQEAFLSAFVALDRFEGRSSVGTWLHRIVVNAALMRVRARARKAEDPLDAGPREFDADGHRVGREPPAIAPPEDLLHRRRVRARVREAIASLPDRHREVIVLRDIEGFNTEETARLLETTAAAVKIRLHRARGALKRLLAPVWTEELS